MLSLVILNVVTTHIRLDVDHSGSINRDDFKSNNKDVQALYDKLYSVIQHNFDFDGDMNIEPKEFFDGFVLMTWTSDRAKSRNFVPGKIGEEFHEWVCRFNEQLENMIDNLVKFIEDPK